MKNSFKFVLDLGLLHKQRGLQPEQKKCFETSYRRTDQSIFWTYLFLHKLQYSIINQI